MYDLWKEIDSKNQNLESSKCITPDLPYCPCCQYGMVIHEDSAYFGEDDTFTKWVCLLENPDSLGK